MHIRIHHHFSSFFFRVLLVSPLQWLVDPFKLRFSPRLKPLVTPLHIPSASCACKHRYVHKKEGNILQHTRQVHFSQPSLPGTVSPFRYSLPWYEHPSQTLQQESDWSTGCLQLTGEHLSVLHVIEPPCDATKRASITQQSVAERQRCFARLRHFS